MGKIWRKWRDVTERVGNLQATVFFSILYFLLFTPIGLIVAQFSDYVSIKTGPSWKKINDNSSSLSRLRKQYLSK